METDQSDAGKREIQEKLATGQITIAEAMGVSRRQLYAIAKRGYELLNSGRLEEARQIYAGLIAADPFDSVFHCHLGAVLWRMGEIERAFAEFNASIRLNIANVDALSARGELYLLKGEVKKGVEDLRKALENDLQGTHPSSLRARALLFALRQAAGKKRAA
jgi:tetratricopeptide (TPR) repeat protein